MSRRRQAAVAAKAARSSAAPPPLPCVEIPIDDIEPAGTCRRRAERDHARRSAAVGMIKTADVGGHDFPVAATTEAADAVEARPTSDRPS